ncbi:Uncharacterised protein [Metamycoplasma cloacale]|uniref:Uncharacterized protein n=1 Tax=Metamycoplasma cloacale TaxID=92401 RepID=A0A2Z4LN86_9BACT|nr:hypothetical protein [Metamycoplasma cloacale]AWX42828.1 hypothetical protein DK849_01990 [Metamycoplasma cloacale]VEU79353.1 Uncharacterised protein [Metamycoplasma cloacale]
MNIPEVTAVKNDVTIGNTFSINVKPYSYKPLLKPAYVANNSVLNNRPIFIEVERSLNSSNDSMYIEIPKEIYSNNVNHMHLKIDDKKIDITSMRKREINNNYYRFFINDGYDDILDVTKIKHISLRNVFAARQYHNIKFGIEVDWNLNNNFRSNYDVVNNNIKLEFIKHLKIKIVDDSRFSIQKKDLIQKTSYITDIKVNTERAFKYDWNDIMEIKTCVYKNNEAQPIMYEPEMMFQPELLLKLNSNLFSLVKEENIDRKNNHQIFKYSTVDGYTWNKGVGFEYRKNANNGAFIESDFIGTATFEIKGKIWKNRDIKLTGSKEIKQKFYNKESGVIKLLINTKNIELSILNEQFKDRWITYS